MAKIFRALSLWREKFRKSSRAEKFQLLTDLYNLAPYGWGDENILKTDCSGLVCGAFIFMGYVIRVTAEDLRQKVFTKQTSELYDKDKVKVVFFVRDGKAVHIGIIKGPNVLYHAEGEGGVHYESIQSVISRRRKTGQIPEYRELVWENLEKWKGEVHGLDEEME